MNSNFNQEVHVEGVPYKGVTVPIGGITDRTKFINTIDRGKWSMMSNMIQTMENVLHLYPNISSGVWDGTFYSGIESANIIIAAKVDWGDDIKNIMGNLPYRNQDRRDTYVTAPWGTLGDFYSGVNVDYNEVITNDSIYLCQSFPVYDGGDGI